MQKRSKRQHSNQTPNLKLKKQKGKEKAEVTLTNLNQLPAIESLHLNRSEVDGCNGEVRRE